MPTSLALSPLNPTQFEGDGGLTYFVFTVTRSGDLSGPTTARYVTQPRGFSPASPADFGGSDYPSGQLWFGAGEATKQIWLPIAADDLTEQAEDFFLRLTDVTGATLETSVANGRILDDDGPAPSLLIERAVSGQAEGASGATAFTFTVTRSGDLSAASSAAWTVSGGQPAGGLNDVAADAADFVGGAFPTGVVSFAPGQETATIVVNAAGDTTPEATESFTVRLSNPSNAAIAGTGGASADIQNDDAGRLGLVSPGVPQPEGTGGTTNIVFTVTREAGSTGAASVDWRVNAGGATAFDFAGGFLPVGTVNFAAGQTSATFTVPVAADAAIEPNESFTVSLLNPVNAYLPFPPPGGGATIQNDDTAPPPTTNLIVNGDFEAPGSAGTWPAGAVPGWHVASTGRIQTIELSDKGSGDEGLVLPPDTALAVSPGGVPTYIVHDVAQTVSTQAGATYTLKWDYYYWGAAHTPTAAAQVLWNGQRVVGQLAEGQFGGPTAHWVTLEAAVTGSGSDDLTLRGAASTPGAASASFDNLSLVAGPAPTQATLSVSPFLISLSEGNDGARDFQFTVTRTGDASGVSSARWFIGSSEVSSPASPDDFVGGGMPTATVTFAPGETSKQIVVQVAGDRATETDERFRLTITDPVGAVISLATADGVIVNDDPLTGTGVTGTSGDDVFTLSPDANLIVTGYDAPGQDALGIPTGPGGFSLAGYTGRSSLTVVEANAWWNNISGAQVIRWTGDAADVDRASKVDALLQAMPGNGGGGVLFLADGPGDAVSVYYDASAAQPGGARLVATLNGLLSPAQLNATDFKPVTGGELQPGDVTFGSPTPHQIAEGASGTTSLSLTLTRNTDTAQPVTVAWSTKAFQYPQIGASADGSDFVGGQFPSGQVTFAAGSSTATIVIPIAGDTSVEPYETFQVDVISLSGVYLANTIGQINNDDGIGAVGTAGDDVFRLSPTANLVITGYDAAGQDALGVGSDFVGFSPGVPNVIDASAWWNGISGADVIRWTGDPTAVDSAAKVDALLQAMPGNGGGGGRFFIAPASGGGLAVFFDTDAAHVGGISQVATLQGIASPTALNASDFKHVTPPTLSLLFGPGRLEGAAFSYTVTRSGDLSGASQADWAVTAAGPSFGLDIVNGADFADGVLPSGVVAFAPGQASAVITVPVVSDATPEPTEYFNLTLTHPVGATVSSGQTYGSVENDDAGEIILVGATPSGPRQSLSEGDAGYTMFTFTVNRAAGTVGESSVHWRVAPPGGNTGAPLADASDFAGGVLPSGLLTFAAGQTSASFTVAVAGDTILEANESFYVEIYDLVNGYIPGFYKIPGLNGVTSATILNDDGGSAAGTNGDDVFRLSPSSTLTITGYDVSGQDVLGIPVGAGGFSIRGGGTSPLMADASAWWSNIQNGEIIRWTGDLAAADTASEIDALLEAMPGSGGGRLFVGGAAGGAVGVYYDPNSQMRGDASLIATIGNLSDPRALSVADFYLFF